MLFPRHTQAGNGRTRRIPRISATIRWLLPGILLCLPALEACSGGAPPRQVILVLLDAARADRLSGYGYSRQTTPALDALGARGVVFLNHYAQATTTRASLPSLLTSRHFIPPLFPASDRVPYSSPSDLFRSADEAVLSLPRALAGKGFHTALISAHTWLGEETAFAAQFDEAHDLSSRLAFDPSRGYPDAEAVMDYTLDWLSRHGGEDFFLYLHLMDTHFPHREGPEARAYLGRPAGDPIKPERFTEAGGVRDISRALAPDEKAYLDALYDGSLRRADSQLGRLFRVLDSGSGRPLVAVTSDHGEALMEAPHRFGHGIPPYEAVARIPLILWEPSTLRPGRIDAWSSGIDLAPTLMGLLGERLPPGKSFDGRDLTPLLAGLESDEGTDLFMRRAIRSGRWKCIFNAEEEILLAEKAPTYGSLSGELYDLESDPSEISNMWESRPEVVSEMLERYRAGLSSFWSRYTASTRSRQPEGPFAIAARHLLLSPRRECIGEIARLEGFFGSGEGWMRFCDGQGDFLLGDEGAGPLEISVPVPSGRYRLRLGLLGGAALTLQPGGEVIPVPAGPFDPWDWFPWAMESVPAGQVEVSGDLFRAVLAPLPDGAPLAIGYLGFTPAEIPANPLPGEAERLERLRSLGYID